MQIYILTSLCDSFSYSGQASKPVPYLTLHRRHFLVFDKPSCFDDLHVSTTINTMQDTFFHFLQMYTMFKLSREQRLRHRWNQRVLDFAVSNMRQSILDMMFWGHILSLSQNSSLFTSFRGNLTLSLFISSKMKSVTLKRLTMHS